MNQQASEARPFQRPSTVCYRCDKEVHLVIVDYPMFCGLYYPLCPACHKVSAERVKHGR